MKISKLISNFTDVKAKLKANGFNSEFLQSLKSGRFLIPEKMIQKSVAEQLDEVEEIIASDCSCAENGVNIFVTVVKSGVKFKIDFVFTCTEFQISSEKQLIRFIYKCERVEGKNFLGKLASTLLNCILRNIIEKKLGKSISEHDIEVDTENRVVLADLENLSVLAPFLKKVPVLNISALDVFSVVSAHHSAKGIELKLKTFLAR